MELIRVSADSSVPAVASAITSVLLEYHQAEVQAVGADAANQAVQALEMAICCLQNSGISVTSETRFAKVNVDHRLRTAVKLLVRQASSPSFAPVDARNAELPRA